jgi:hypothetical protein
VKGIGVIERRDGSTARLQADGGAIAVIYPFGLSPRSRTVKAEGHASAAAVGECLFRAAARW